jgi:hypothetical protein
MTTTQYDCREEDSPEENEFMVHDYDSHQEEGFHALTQMPKIRRKDKLIDLGDSEEEEEDGTYDNLPPAPTLYDGLSVTT